MRSFVLALLMVISFPLFAAEVIKVKGKGVLVELKGDPAVNGDIFYLISPDGKRVGIIKISKVKGDKAIGKLAKGRAEPGFTLEFKPNKTAKASGGGGGGSHMASPSMDDGSTSSKRSYWGAMVGFSMDSMSVSVTETGTNKDLGTVAMSGNGYAAKGLFDYELFSQIWFRGTSGIEMLNFAGDSKCGVTNKEACTAKLMYLTFDFIGRYVFGQGSFRPWAGGGMGLLFPASKDATALDPSSISTTNVILLAGGFDYFLSPTMYIPISIEYGLLPKSDEVSANWIAIRGGVAIPF